MHEFTTDDLLKVIIDFTDRLRHLEKVAKIISQDANRCICKQCGKLVFLVEEQDEYIISEMDPDDFICRHCTTENMNEGIKVMHEKFGTMTPQSEYKVNITDIDILDAYHLISFSQGLIANDDSLVIQQEISKSRDRLVESFDLQNKIVNEIIDGLNRQLGIK